MESVRTHLIGVGLPHRLLKRFLMIGRHVLSCSKNSSVVKARRIHELWKGVNVNEVVNVETVGEPGLANETTVRIALEEVVNSHMFETVLDMTTIGEKQLEEESPKQEVVLE